jgi:arylsulfatase A-like enzyme
LQAVTVIERHDFEESQPFFLYLAFQAPHAPVQAAPDHSLLERCGQHTKGEGRDVYCTMVSTMDTRVGDVVAAMKAKQAWANTIVIFTTDNGGCMPTENRGCNAPLRGGKHHLFEGGVRGEGFM